MERRRKRRLCRYGRSRSGRYAPIAAADTEADDTTKKSFDPATMFFPSSDQIDHSQKPPSIPLKRPVSQKEATMPPEPSAENVEMVMAFVPDVDRSTAVRYLKAKHNDVQAAVNAMLDREDISKIEAASTWDESAWTQDRNGDQSDQYLQPLGASSATATRPNSPAPSLLRQQMHPTTKAEEDEDFAKALEMSQADVGGVHLQETGRISASGQETNFGPATRRDYDERMWGMVPSRVQDYSDEVILELDAEDRINLDGQPRLLKHSPDGDYTAAFLTICHAVSGAREALLMRHHLQEAYGEDGDWWRGHSISLPKIVHLPEENHGKPQDDPHDDLITEVQRLMAFLTASHRSYASVGPLKRIINAWTTNLSTARSRTFLETFIEKWTEAAKSQGEGSQASSHLFTTTVGTNASDGMDTPNMNLVDLPVTILDGEKSDLLEHLDELLWDSERDDENVTENYIERPAEVIVVRAYQQNSAETRLRLEVPSYLFIDKYMAENVEATRAVRSNMIRCKQRITTIERVEEKLKTWRHPTKNVTLDTHELLTHTLGHYSGRNRAAVLATDKFYIPSNSDEEQQYESQSHREIAQKLENIIASIGNKLEMLSNEKTLIRKAIADASKNPLPGRSPSDLKYRYTLRGVSTRPNVTYVLRPTDPFQEQTEKRDDDETPEGMQWWRMEYEVNSTGSSAKITKTKAADYDVLRAVELEHRSALLVYASDSIQADTPESHALPPSLREFIEKDNEMFRQELAHERSRPSYADDLTYSTHHEIRPSIEDRRGSLDSTRVQGSRSPSPPGYNDVDMIHHPASYGLGYDLKRGMETPDDELPVHEIRLPEDEGIGMEAEMVEKPTAPSLFINDAAMEDAGGSNDHDTLHLEHTGNN